MNKVPLNRLKIVLVEHNKTNKWLSEKLKKNITTISRWCTNDSQPSLETFFDIASILDVDVHELIVSSKYDGLKSKQ